MRTDRRAVKTLLQAESAPSRFAQRCLATCAVPVGGLALDIPCGAGRHIETLRARGYAVVGADLSADLLKEASRRSGQNSSIQVNTAFVRLDGSRALPFTESAFDMVLVVHFFLPGLVRRLSTLVKPGGYFILETFGAHGGNHAHLPVKGQVRNELSGEWMVVEDHERSVRSAIDRQVVQFFCRRK